ncbi:MAG: HAMP domain-containing protein [Anaerolineae bacterium]|nr:HAMP domain-containing protein [Anaerolineae bacterium]
MKEELRVQNPESKGKSYTSRFIHHVSRITFQLSLRARLTLSFLIIIVITATLVGLLANRFTANQFTEMVSTTGQMQAQRLAPVFADYYAETGSWEGVETLFTPYSIPGEIMRSNMMPGGRMRGNMPSQKTQPQNMRGMMGYIMMENAGEHLLLFDASGNLIADSHHTEDTMHLTHTDVEKGVSISIGEQQVGTLVVTSALGTLTTSQTDFLKQVNILLLGAVLLAALAGLVMSSLQARRITAPIRALVNAAHHIAAGDLGQRIPVTSNDELAEIASAFNTMADRLAEQQVLRHRAMSDIAHELRTPLSVLQIDLESLEDGLLSPTPAIISGLQTEVIHLKHLVEDLRLLTLAEAGELTIEEQLLDAGALVREVTARIQTTAQDKAIQLQIQLPDNPLPISGDPQRLAQVLLNLLANALQYTPKDGEITVSASRQAQEVHITVADTGMGISPEDLPHLFERLYRANLPHQRSHDSSGLGLAIARSLVEAHREHIWVTSTINEGSTFTFALPLASNILNAH